MDDRQNRTNLFEFLKLLQRGEFKEIQAVRKIIQNLTNIIDKTLKPSIVLISIYDRDTEFLIPFSISNPELKKEEFEIELETFESNNPFADIFTTSTPIWIQMESVSDKFELKKKFMDMGINEIITKPLLHNNLNRRPGRKPDPLYHHLWNLGYWPPVARDSWVERCQTTVVRRRGGGGNVPAGAVPRDIGRGVPSTERLPSRLALRHAASIRDST